MRGADRLRLDAMGGAALQLVSSCVFLSLCVKGSMSFSVYVGQVFNLSDLAPSLRRRRSLCGCCTACYQSVHIPARPGGLQSRNAPWPLRHHPPARRRWHGRGAGDLELIEGHPHSVPAALLIPLRPGVVDSHTPPGAAATGGRGMRTNSMASGCHRTCTVQILPRRISRENAMRCPSGDHDG
jgi:hypothetical protein